MKLTGAYRISTAAGFADIDPMAAALIAAAPDRLIWGSDYPHLSFADKVGTVELFNLLHRWAPDVGNEAKDPGREPGAAVRIRHPRMSTIPARSDHAVVTQVIIGLSLLARRQIERKEVRSTPDGPLLESRQPASVGGAPQRN